MSEENVKKDVIDVEAEQAPTTAQQPEEAAPEQKKIEIQYGFVVGVNQDGGVVLDMIGEKKGLIEMLGLCKYAEYHLNYTLDAASGQGTPIISQQVHQLAEMMKVLLNVIAQGRKPQQNPDSRIVTP
jgi:hypothetical protein